eukprot:TRINITY_DN39616_c0_g1_i1.p1 TRINITY_DN39616_c0_g1~~TRINITY_DN39616_c0_g1_i1.p1  ORF type:complete len:121 (+),score=26.91 TRINITY_DN39616_c0_g1_i1:122-484(+)
MAPKRIKSAKASASNLATREQLKVIKDTIRECEGEITEELKEWIDEQGIALSKKELDDIADQIAEAIADKWIDQGIDFLSEHILEILLLTILLISFVVAKLFFPESISSGSFWANFRELF